MVRFKNARAMPGCDVRFNALLVLLTAFIHSSQASEEPVEPNRLELAGHHALHRVIRQTSEPLSEFVTDGCSGGLSDTWRVVAETFPEFLEAHGETPPWESCCITHDRAYHRGGRDVSVEESFQDRVRADQALRACVVEHGAASAKDLAVHYSSTEEDVLRAYRTIGEAMYLSVRIGGVPCSGLPWRWGFGSPRCWVGAEDYRNAGSTPEN